MPKLDLLRKSKKIAKYYWNNWKIKAKNPLEDAIKEHDAFLFYKVVAVKSGIKLNLTNARKTKKYPTWKGLDR